MTICLNCKFFLREEEGVRCAFFPETEFGDEYIPEEVHGCDAYEPR